VALSFSRTAPWSWFGWSVGQSVSQSVWSGLVGVSEYQKESK
jgi:hypothetical protein